MADLTAEVWLTGAIMILRLVSSTAAMYFLTSQGTPPPQRGGIQTPPLACAEPMGRASLVAATQTHPCLKSADGAACTGTCFSYTLWPCSGKVDDRDGSWDRGGSTVPLSPSLCQCTPMQRAAVTRFIPLRPSIVALADWAVGGGVLREPGVQHRGGSHTQPCTGI